MSQWVSQNVPNTSHGEGNATLVNAVHVLCVPPEGQWAHLPSEHIRCPPSQSLEGKTIKLFAYKYESADM